MSHWRSLFILILATLVLTLRHSSQTAAQFIPPLEPSYEQRLVELVNQERWVNGRLPPLKSNATLDLAAETHSSRMAVRNFLDHCDFDTGSAFWQRIEQAGYTDWYVTGENIAAGYKTPEEVIAGWMNSQSHRSNILATDFWEVGSGYVYQTDDGQDVRQGSVHICQANSSANGPFYHYWTQDFGRRKNVLPVIINREAYVTGRREVSLYLYGTGWAQSVRLRNENGLWSPWLPFTPDMSWALSSGDGLKTVTVELSSGAGGTGLLRTASDSIWLRSAVPVTAVSRNYPHHVYLPMIRR